MIVYRDRYKLLLFFIIGVCAIFIIRLFYLQIIAVKYKQFAEENVLQRKTVYPPRGLLYDRKGIILVSNEAVYDLMVIPRQVKSIDTAEFCEILNIAKEEYVKILEEASAYSRYKASAFIKSISLETYGKLQEKMFRFRGFYVQPRMIRKYNQPLASHALGYLGEVNQNDIDESEGYYARGDLIGISGIEKFYEKDLRGVNGERFVLVDVFNTEQGSYLDGALDRAVEPGYNLITSLNMDLQAYAEYLMKDKKGGIVAIQPSTGDILAMVSGPTYDPSLLNGRERSKNYRMLLLDPDKPLFNRALTAMYPPGSTFKVVMAAVGLDQGVITPDRTVPCGGAYILGSLRIGCHEHPSPVDLNYSIILSCNTYYCTVFRATIDQKRFTSVRDGYINWRDNVMLFGIGRKLGVDLPNESPGILPLPERYDKIYGKNRWKSSNILSLAIGQAEISLTPLQLANVAAIMANRGYYIQPHIVMSKMKDGIITKYNFKKYRVNIDPRYLTYIVEGMSNVPKIGTAIRYGPSFNSFDVCGKTGTAQNPHGEEHSVFIAFAPKDNPKIVVAAVIENAGQGAHWAAPICFLLIEKHLSGQVNPDHQWIEEIMLSNAYQGINTSAKKRTTDNMPVDSGEETVEEQQEVENGAD